MKLKIGVVGLPLSGKSTVFSAITGSLGVATQGKGRLEPNLATVKVPDPRVEELSKIYSPQKTTHAQVQYVDLAEGATAHGGSKEKELDYLIHHLNEVNALVHVVRNFHRAGEPPTPQSDFEAFEEELILADLMMVEKRIDRLGREITKGKKGDPAELELLKQAKEVLESQRALRGCEFIHEPQLKGYGFLSAKPCIVVLNSDESSELPKTELPPGLPVVEVHAKLEVEILELPPEEAQGFREEMGIVEPATHRLIRESYSLLDLISFFTVGEDEVRAWTIRRGTTAQKAAGVIHSDIEKGFIRAEVLSYEDHLRYGTFKAAQKAGKVRLEGKDYLVQDGDIMSFRFNV